MTGNYGEPMEDQPEYLLMSQVRPRLGGWLGLFIYLFETGFLYASCPITLCVDQAGLDLTEICMPLPPKCWD